jgi:hypothetical protein
MKDLKDLKDLKDFKKTFERFFETLKKFYQI